MVVYQPCLSSFLFCQAITNKKLHILIVTLTKVTMIDNVKLMDYLSPFGGYVQPF
jgi:hypothetical protein